jgi:hypothetical protein
MKIEVTKMFLAPMSNNVMRGGGGCDKLLFLPMSLISQRKIKSPISTLGDKVWQYAEHLGEQTGNMVRTHWEFDRNTLRTSKFNPPLPPKGKNLGQLAALSLWLSGISVYNCVYHPLLPTLILPSKILMENIT